MVVTAGLEQRRDLLGLPARDPDRPGRATPRSASSRPTSASTSSRSPTCADLDYVQVATGGPKRPGVARMIVTRRIAIRIALIIVLAGRAPGLVLLVPELLRDDPGRRSRWSWSRSACSAARWSGAVCGLRGRVAARLGAAPDAGRLVAGAADGRLPGRPLPRGLPRSRTRWSRRCSIGALTLRRRGRVRGDPADARRPNAGQPPGRCARSSSRACSAVLLAIPVYPLIRRLLRPALVDDGRAAARRAARSRRARRRARRRAARRRCRRRARGPSRP